MLLFKSKLFLLAITLEIVIVSAYVSRRPENETAIIYRTLKETLGRCIKDELNPAIFVGDIEWAIESILPDTDYNPTLLIDENVPVQDKERYHGGIATFILYAHSRHSISRILSILNFSRHWDIDATFFFVGILKNSCEEPTGILKIAWQKKLLRSLFLCYDYEINKVKYYTYNPFTNYAPDPWKAANEYLNSRRRWTLYERVYNAANDGLCDNLFFDKTKYLDGYEMKIVDDDYNRYIIRDDQKNVTLNSNLEFVKNLPLYHLTLSLLENLNITPVYVLNDPDWRDNTSRSNGFMEKLDDGTYDISFSEKLLTDIHSHTTWPINHVDMVVMTKKRPFRTPTENILLFYEPYALCVSILAMFITLVVLMMAKKLSYGQAFLEIMRLVANSVMVTKKFPLPAKIYFFGIFWFLVIFIGTFQGNLARFLTSPSRENVDTLDDLCRLRYHIYTSKYFTDTYRFIFDGVNPNYLHAIKSYHCTEIVLNKSDAACFDEIAYISKDAEKHRFHISQPIVTDYNVFWTSRDFLYQNKLDSLIIRHYENGFHYFWYAEASSKVKERLSLIESYETSKNFRPIKLQNLLFVFRILFAGWICSIIAFMFEIRSGYKKKRTCKKMIRKCKKR